MMGATRGPVFGANGMVASSQTAATQAGVDILRRGGSAIDAAIATNAALSVIEPHMCGMGGDLFAIIIFASSSQPSGSWPSSSSCGSTTTPSARFRSSSRSARSYKNSISERLTSTDSLANWPRSVRSSTSASTGASSSRVSPKLTKEAWSQCTRSSTARTIASSIK